VDETTNIINMLPLEQNPKPEDISAAFTRVGGSPGMVLAVMGSAGAKAFDAFAAISRPKLSALSQIANDLGARGQGPDAFKFFSDMLLDHVAKSARATGSAKVAEAYQALSQNLRIAEAFNLDRKQAAFEAMRLANDALKQT
jgi:hypothetical protein